MIKEQLDACADITEALRSALVTVEGSAANLGDAQLSVDVGRARGQIMWDARRVAPPSSRGAPRGGAASVKPCNPNGRFTVCRDPSTARTPSSTTTGLDGTMIGIAKESVRGEDGLLGATGAPPGHRAHRALYGGRTTVLWLDDGVYERRTAAPRRVPAPRRHVRVVDLLQEAD